MNDDSNEPISSTLVREPGSAEGRPLPAIRHDGWTGEAMAKFLETLAETGIVLDACDAAGKSSTAAYAHRRRHPLFAEAWEKALGIARDRLADTLLARSIEGNVEQIIKDGEIVAEKHFIDNRLGLAVLKRLDQRAAFPGTGRGPGQRGNAAPQRLDSGLRRKTDGLDWEMALTALRTGEEDAIAAALAMLKGDEVGEVCDPPFEDVEGDSFDHPRLWRDWAKGEWRTNFPPPPGFDGHEDDEWEDDTYCRALSAEELAALVAAGIAETSESLGEVSLEQDEAERDAFFADLAARAHDDSRA